MKLPPLYPALLLFALVSPVQGMEPAEPVLQAASKALDHYQQLATSIHCEDATTSELAQDCLVALEGLGTRVHEAKETLARYHQLSSPRLVDLFDAYQAFRRVMEESESLIVVSDFYGESNRQHFAEIYNSFVKINGWFGGVVREAIQDAPDGKCPERGHS